MIKEQWKKIGIQADIKEVERSLYFIRIRGNEHQIAIWANDGTELLYLFPRHGLPVDPAESLLDRFEDDDRAVHVHARPALRIGADEWHLHRREVDDVRDLVVVECGGDGDRVRDVAFDQGDPCAFLVREHEAKPGVVGAGEVEPDRLLAEAEQRLQRPGADASESARDECPLSQAARPGRR